jgi:hypothetical protein
MADDRSIGIDLIAAERRRQITVKGYSVEHDAGYKHKEPARIALALLYAYCNPGKGTRDEWGIIDKHHNNLTQILVIAGALTAAELDRRKRVKDQEEREEKA